MFPASIFVVALLAFNLDYKVSGEDLSAVLPSPICQHPCLPLSPPSPLSGYPSYGTPPPPSSFPGYPEPLFGAPPPPPSIRTPPSRPVQANCPPPPASTECCQYPSNPNPFEYVPVRDHSPTPSLPLSTFSIVILLLFSFVVVF